MKNARVYIHFAMCDNGLDNADPKYVCEKQRRIMSGRRHTVV